MSGVFRNYSFGKWIYKHSSISTNADISISVSKNTPNTNIVLYTYKQWAGKGQIGRKWHSGEDKNLTFSLLVDLKQLLAKDQFHLNMIISLAIRDWVDRILKDNGIKNKNCTVKWPNDIYVDNKKLLGILIQNTLVDKYISKSIIGMGINVNEKEFPEDIPNPVSLSQLTNKNFDLNLLFANLLSFLEKRFFYYDQMSFSNLQKQYISKMYLLNERKTFTLSENDQSFQAEIVGVTKEGMLMLQQKERMSHFNFREVKYTIE